MTYSPYIPSTIPSDDQEDILFNFQTLNDQYTINHIPFDAISKNGYHKKIFFFQNNARPDRIAPRATLYPKYVIYNKDTPQQQTISELFYQNGNTAGDERQLVDLILSSSDEHVKQTANGIGFKTPWGLIINMGQVKKQVPPSPTPYDWPIPFTTQVYTVIIRGYNPPSAPGTNTAEAYTNSVTINSFRLLASGTSLPNGSVTEKYYYMAIGK